MKRVLALVARSRRGRHSPAAPSRLPSCPLRCAITTATPTRLHHHHNLWCGSYYYTTSTTLLSHRNSSSSSSSSSIIEAEFTEKKNVAVPEQPSSKGAATCDTRSADEGEPSRVEKHDHGSNNYNNCHHDQSHDHNCDHSHDHHDGDDRDDVEPFDFHAMWKEWLFETEEENDKSDDHNKPTLLKSSSDHHHHHHHHHPNYGRIIDAARLTADMAFENNGAVVGALAEASGDEGAAEQWLLGFWNLFIGGTTPTNPLSTSGKKDDDDDDEHLQRLLQLARNRGGNHFIKHCTDDKKLRKHYGNDDYASLEMAATVVLESLTDNLKPHQNTNNTVMGSPPHHDNDDKEEDPLAFSPQVLEKSYQLWGPEIVQELQKLSPEEQEHEQQMIQMEQQGMAYKQEAGNWWGTDADETSPKEAYHRLIDAARYGTMLAYEKEMKYIGAIADALSNVPPESEPSMPLPPKEEEDDDENNTTATIKPTEVGPNAIKHFDKFLQELKGDNANNLQLMPEWWNDDHDAAVWKLAKDMDGDRCLAYPLDKDEVRGLYKDNKGIVQKISLLADVAKQCMDYKESATDDEMQELFGSDFDPNNIDMSKFGDDYDKDEIVGYDWMEKGYLDTDDEEEEPTDKQSKKLL